MNLKEAREKEIWNNSSGSGRSSRQQRKTFPQTDLDCGFANFKTKAGNIAEGFSR
jgi:hypothetical protein